MLLEHTKSKHTRSSRLPSRLPEGHTGPPELPRLVIERAVSHVFDVDISDISSATRGKKQVALARQVAMYLAHITCGLTLTETGQLFMRDRTTVAHACSLVEDRRDDASFDLALEFLDRAIGNLLRPWCRQPELRQDHGWRS